jgi:hypothetical protein
MDIFGDLKTPPKEEIAMWKLEKKFVPTFAVSERR